MKYKINGKVIEAEELAIQPDAKLWIRAIQTAQALAFTEAGLKAIGANEDSSALGKTNIESCFKNQLALIGIEIVE